MAEKSVKIPSKKRKFIWILGIFFLSAALLSGSLYQCLPLLIKKLVPIVAKSEGYTVRLSEVRTSYGLITIEGISLTVARIDSRSFDVHIIPTTWEETNLLNLHKGSYVNLETDMIGKYVKQFMEKEDSSNITMESLNKAGF
jgi:hypothetical protein